MVRYKNILIIFVVVLSLACLSTVYAVPGSTVAKVDYDADYRSFVFGLIALLLTVLGFLISSIALMFKQSVDKICKKYEDQEHRLTVHETLCAACRKQCPEHGDK